MLKAPARRKPDGHFEVRYRKFSGLDPTAQEHRTPKFEKEPNEKAEKI
jgi:hypothetical protein